MASKLLSITFLFYISEYNVIFSSDCYGVAKYEADWLELFIPKFSAAFSRLIRHYQLQLLADAPSLSAKMAKTPVPVPKSITVFVGCLFFPWPRS
jgi:hypothetical protein